MNALLDWVFFRLVMAYPIAWTQGRFGYWLWLKLLPRAGSHAHKDVPRWEEGQ